MLDILELVNSHINMYEKFKVSISEHLKRCPESTFESLQRQEIWGYMDYGNISDLNCKIQALVFIKKTVEDFNEAAKKLETKGQ